MELDELLTQGPRMGKSTPNDFRELAKMNDSQLPVDPKLNLWEEDEVLEVVRSDEATDIDRQIEHSSANLDAPKIDPSINLVPTPVTSSLESRDPDPVDFESSPSPQLVDPTHLIPPLDPRSESSEWELTQVAGLDAGARFELDLGTVTFTEVSQPKFAMNLQDDEATIVPGNDEILLDGVPVTTPTSTTAGTITTDAAMYRLRRRGDRPAGASRRPTFVDVPLFRSADSSNWRFGQPASDISNDLSELELEFFASVRNARNRDANSQRFLHPDPSEILQRLKHTRTDILERGLKDGLFARIPIAFGNLPWYPRLPEGALIPNRIHGNINQLCELPGVPITSNLTNGPLAICGPREASLALARNAMVSLASLSMPGSVELKVLTTTREQTDDWGWLSGLPHWLSSTDNLYRVVVADGYAAIEASGIKEKLLAHAQVGMILVSRSVAEAPGYCSIVLQVEESGAVRATNSEGNQLTGMGIGLSTGTALTLCDALDEAYHISA